MPVSGRPGGRYLFTLSLAALGVVYGDIGTSPLYAIRECFYGAYGIPVDPANVLGVLSLIIWSLILVVSVKYLAFVVRADNRGEGGILALMALIVPGHEPARGATRRLVVLGLFGAALLYGDGMITPAISVLSAIEGLEVATPLFQPYVVPATLAILVALFCVQHRGTAKVGAVFGPITFVWFAALAALGVRAILGEPAVLHALNPVHAGLFFAHNGLRGALVLAAVFLVVTGTEALYADMGHFGRRPIRLVWFAVVLPALLLNYLGQGALLLVDPEAAHNPFYRLAPSWALYPLVALSTLATIIASQAMISGAFSLTRQAVQLGYSPRLAITHTSSEEEGQIYIAPINWLLMIACCGLVVGFGASTNLAAAYGMAVTTTMAITTVLFYVLARRRWHWHPLAAGGLAALFLAIDVAFLGANAVKIQNGGWFPLVVALAVFAVMSSWKRGREVLGRRLRDATLPLAQFLAGLAANPVPRVPGTAIFMTGDPESTPHALLHNFKHNRVVHERVVVLTVITAEVPAVSASERLGVESLGHGFWRVVARFGFMQDPNVPRALALAASPEFEFDPMRATYFLGREKLIAAGRSGMALWRERLFAFLSRNAEEATAFFRLPPNCVVELGAQIEL
ncbi:MAG TPA: potassium transporter Kup [Myxococcota bacterium]|nr:potassium transporter Kup [Myxococcota bacterium]